VHEREAIWRANPRNQPVGLDIGGMST
jgi:hypothetical protein